MKLLDNFRVNYISSKYRLKIWRYDNMSKKDYSDGLLGAIGVTILGILGGIILAAILSALTVKSGYSTCPVCNSPIQRYSYKCPNCHAPLQWG